jgi:hypothetical protein
MPRDRRLYWRCRVVNGSQPRVLASCRLRSSCQPVRLEALTYLTRPSLTSWSTVRRVSSSGVPGPRCGLEEVQVVGLQRPKALCTAPSTCFLERPTSLGASPVAKRTLVAYTVSSQPPLVVSQRPMSLGAPLRVDVRGVDEIAPGLGEAIQIAPGAASSASRPGVIAPRHSWLTRTPVGPMNLSCIEAFPASLYARPGVTRAGAVDLPKRLTR